MTNQNIDVLWDDNPVDITSEAKLAVGSSITFVDFIWSTYENQNLDKLEG